MRGKRSKQYRKLIQSYGLTFGFREPYQILIDAQMIQDTSRFKMDLVKGLERVMHGKIKPMITQCSIRHLYNLTIPQSEKNPLIELARTMERRRCNHHTLDEPLSALECLSSVIDPRASATNKNRYAVASQEEEVRRFCRGVKGVPLIYVKRSVMILEPMAEESLDVREDVEREKFRVGLKKRGAGGLAKRERVEDTDGGMNTIQTHDSDGNENMKKKRRIRGPKGPNPLSVKKPKKERQTKEVHTGDEKGKQGIVEMVNIIPFTDPEPQIDIIEKPLDPTLHKRKRRRRNRLGELEDLKRENITAAAVTAVTV